MVAKAIAVTRINAFIATIYAIKYTLTILLIGLTNKSKFINCHIMESQKFKNIGIFGGTFDPIHIGHLLCAQAAFDKLNLDLIYFMVANIPNFKQEKNIAPILDRLVMVKLALTDYGNKDFLVSDFELNRCGISYTSDTLIKLSKKNNKLFFICGTDAASNIDKWHEPEKMFANATIVTLTRKGYKSDVIDKIDKRIKIIEADIPEVSSSEIRSNKKEKYLTKSVKEYIKSKNLYNY